MKRLYSLVSLLLLSISPGFGQTPALSVSDQGVVIDAGSMGKFTLDAPSFSVSGGGKAEKPVVEKKGDMAGIARYPSGLELEFNTLPNRVNFRFRNGPPKGKSFKFAMRFPIKFHQGGGYAVDGGPVQPLPAVLGDQFVAKGNAKSFSLVDPMGQGFTLSTPGGYFELQDNREFNWQVFEYHWFHNVFGKANGEFVLLVNSRTSEGGTQPGFLVDRFGQSAKVDFPGKVTTEAELKEDGSKQLQEAAAYKQSEDRDIYGGLAGSGKALGLKKTGFFHIEETNGRWVLVDPEGNLFFQLGVCGIATTDDFTTVKGRENIFEWLPKADDPQFKTAWREERPKNGIFSFYIANLIRKFGKPFSLEEWTGQVVTRLRSWGFNSAGAFSKNTDTMKEMKFPNVNFLPIGDRSGLKMLPDKIGAARILDPFAPDAEEIMDKNFASTVAPRKDDPLLIGYFLGNEQHFENLPKLLPSYKASKVPSKARLVKMLEEKYQDIAKFNEAWKPAKPFADFAALGEEPLFIRSEQAAEDMKEFCRLWMESYYSLVERVFRKHDPNHLLIGSRWTPGTSTYRDLVEVAGKHLDVLSINYYSDSIQKEFLTRVHEWGSKKPIILSEWYYSTTSHGLGAGRQTDNEEARGKAYRNYVEQAAALPFVVGSQWFIYTDQALTGRFFEGFNGEGNNTGLVDVTDRPYAELVAAAKETHGRIYDVMLGKAVPFVFDHPRFNGKQENAGAKTVHVPKALAGMTLDGTTTNWPGRPAEPIESTRVVNGLLDERIRGDFRLCWDEKQLYFHIQVKDPTPQRNVHKGDRLWAADAVELFIGSRNIEETGPLSFSDRQILLGAAGEGELHVLDHPEENAQCKIVVVPDVAGDGYTVQAAIPWSVLRVKPEPGLELLFDVAIDNSNDGEKRTQQLVWSGTKQNSKDRGAWGRARLSEN
jgi:hypothetical protein